MCMGMRSGFGRTHASTRTRTRPQGCTKAEAARRRTTALLSATLDARLTGLAAATLHRPATVGFSMAQVGGQG